MRNNDEFYTFSKDGTVNLASGEWIPREVMMTFMSGYILTKAHYLEITTDTRYSYTEEDGLCIFGLAAIRMYFLQTFSMK